MDFYKYEFSKKLGSFSVAEQSMINGGAPIYYSSIQMKQASFKDDPVSGIELIDRCLTAANAVNDMVERVRQIWKQGNTART